MEQHKIDRINELSRKARAGPLTEAEQAERAALRREYLDAVTGSLQSHLDSLYLVDSQGRRQKLRKKAQTGAAGPAAHPKRGNDV